MGYGYFPYVQGGIFPVIQDATGQQLIKLSYGAGMTTLEGPRATTDNLRIKANGTDDYARITLLGGGSMALVGQGGIVLYEQATMMAEVSYAANVTTIEGGSVTGNKLIIKASGADTYPFISLTGGGWLHIETGTGMGVALDDGGTAYGGFSESTDFVISTYSNRDIYLSPNGSGEVKFGTYTAGAATDSTGYIIINDSGGTARKLMVQA